MAQNDREDTEIRRITLHVQDWRRVLMALSVYANQVEENGSDDLAVRVRDVGREIALKLDEQEEIRNV